MATKQTLVQIILLTVTLLCVSATVMAETYQVTGTTLNVRSGAGSSYRKIGSLKQNETVEVLEINGDWAKINYNGKNGYVSVDYLQVYQTSPPVSYSSHNNNSRWGSWGRILVIVVIVIIIVRIMRNRGSGKRCIFCGSHDTKKVSKDFYYENCSNSEGIPLRYGDEIWLCNKCNCITIKNYNNSNDSYSSNHSSSNSSRGYKCGSAGSICSGCHWKQGGNYQFTCHKKGKSLGSSEYIECNEYKY
jgi:hypothetical protein